MKPSTIPEFLALQFQKLRGALQPTKAPGDIDYRELHIVYLDDHRIFRGGMIRSLLPRLPNIRVKECPEVEQALGYINDCFVQDIKIDLIITDYNHPGLSGLAFAKKVRNLEKTYCTRTPILLLTMRWPNEELTKATQEGIFDAYIPKSAVPEDVINFIKIKI